MSNIIDVRVDPRRIPRDAEERVRSAVVDYARKHGVGLHDAEVRVLPQSSEVMVETQLLETSRPWTHEDRKALRTAIVSALRVGWDEQEVSSATTAPGRAVPSTTVQYSSPRIPKVDDPRPRFHTEEGMFEMGRNLERIRIELATSNSADLRILATQAARERDWRKLQRWLRGVIEGKESMETLDPELRIRAQELLRMFEARSA
jgi:hypothetical protein